MAVFEKVSDKGCRESETEPGPRAIFSPGPLAAPWLLAMPNQHMRFRAAGVPRVGKTSRHGGHRLAAGTLFRRLGGSVDRVAGRLRSAARTLRGGANH